MNQLAPGQLSDVLLQIVSDQEGNATVWSLYPCGLRLNLEHIEELGVLENEWLNRGRVDDPDTEFREISIRMRLGQTFVLQASRSR